MYGKGGVEIGIKKVSSYMPLDIVAIRHYYEQPRIIDQHHNYHKRMTQNREEKCPVVYLDRRWPIHDRKDKAWVEKDCHWWYNWRN